MNAADKELIEEKFKGLHAFIISSNDIQAERDARIFEKLDGITDQTTATSGRVNRLEEESSNCPSLVKLEKRVYSLEKWQWKSMGMLTGISIVIGFVFKYIL